MGCLSVGAHAMLVDPVERGAEGAGDEKELSASLSRPRGAFLNDALVLKAVKA